MHELGIATDVARIARETAAGQGAARIVSLRLRVGAWSGVEPASLRFALETLSAPGVCEAGDPLQGVRVDLERVEPEFLCPSCGLEYRGEGYFDPCPRCGGLGGTLVRGEELELVEIEVDDG